MMRWAEHIHSGSILLVTGKVQRPVKEVTGASVHSAEFLIDKLHVVSERADRQELSHQGLPRRQDNRNQPRSPPRELVSISLKRTWQRHVRDRRIKPPGDSLVGKTDVIEPL
jgi:hypothetical protein